MVGYVDIVIIIVVAWSLALLLRRYNRLLRDTVLCSSCHCVVLSSARMKLYHTNEEENGLTLKCQIKLRSVIVPKMKIHLLMDVLNLIISNML